MTKRSKRAEAGVIQNGPGGSQEYPKHSKQNAVSLFGLLFEGSFNRLISFHGSRCVLLAPIGSYWFLLAPIGSYWLLLAPIGSYWLLLALPWSLSHCLFLFVLLVLFCPVCSFPSCLSCVACEFRLSRKHEHCLLNRFILHTSCFLTLMVALAVVVSTGVSFPSHCSLAIVSQGHSHCLFRFVL